MQTIGKYQIKKLLAKGGMGEVYLAFDPICGREVALKCIRENLRKYDSIYKRFLQEARITAKLAHPSIMPIYSIHEEKDFVYYTMPYIEGTTLKQILNETIQKEKEGLTHPVGSSIPALLRIYLSICQGVSFAHSKGIIHRDLKPENVMVGPFGEVLLIDWGLAILESDPSELDDVPVHYTSQNITKPGKIVGTLSYMAPERALYKLANAQTDLYALGVLLYQLLTLRLPFTRKSVEHFKKTATQESYLPPSEKAPHRDIPQKLCDIIDGLLSFDPKNRTANAKELIQNIQDFLEGKPDWIFDTSLSLDTPQDFQLQEGVFVNKNTALSQSKNVTEWVMLNISKATFKENIKIEASLSIEEQSKGVGFLFCLAQQSLKKNLEDGFCLWLGSKSHPGIRLIRNNIEVLHLNDAYLEENAPSFLSIEKLDNHVQISLNKEVILTYVDHIPIMGSHVGLIYKDTEFTLSSWKIYLGSKQAQVNCLSIPDAFLAFKDYDKALYEYQKIALSFKGRQEGREAVFRSGITYIEKAKNTPSQQQELLSLADEEFEKLRTTSGAPLEYLGKSLVCQVEGDLEEEVKYLEMGLRRFEKHPLISRLEEHITFRMHELAKTSRDGTYRFALLALQHMEKSLSNHDNVLFIQDLKDYLEPLYFLQKLDSHRLHHDLSIQLSFWLNKPLALLELSSKCENDREVENVQFALLQLNEYKILHRLVDLNTHPAITLCSQIPERGLTTCYEKLLALPKKDVPWQIAMLLLLEKALIEHQIDLLLQIDLIFFDGPFQEIAHSLMISGLLLNGDIEQAKKSLSSFTAQTLHNTHSYLYPLQGILYAVEKKQHKAFTKLLPEAFPKTNSFLGHYFSKHILYNSKWIEKAYPFEKYCFSKQLMLLHSALDQSEIKEKYRKELSFQTF